MYKRPKWPKCCKWWRVSVRKSKVVDVPPKRLSNVSLKTDLLRSTLFVFDRLLWSLVFLLLLRFFFCWIQVNCLMLWFVFVFSLVLNLSLFCFCECSWSVCLWKQLVMKQLMVFSICWSLEANVDEKKTQAFLNTLHPCHRSQRPIYQENYFICSSTFVSKD